MERAEIGSQFPQIASHKTEREESQRRLALILIPKPSPPDERSARKLVETRQSVALPLLGGSSRPRAEGNGSHRLTEMSEIAKKNARPRVVG